MRMDICELRSTLDQYGQGHLLKHWDQLSESEQWTLYEDLRSIDFAEMNHIFHVSTHPEENEDGKSIDDLMVPIEDEICASQERSTFEELRGYYRTSMGAISRNECGVLLLAGGQGTRLGVAYPKGMYNIGLPSQKTLYQIQVERIRRLQELAELETGVSGGRIMMYIMTSEHTKRPTEEFFESHNFFGLDKDQVVFFEQRMIPCFDMKGKVILETRCKVSRAPDGNGGLYWALRHENVLDHMKSCKVKYLHVYCVDNVLVKVADPMFMGYCIDKGAESGNKVVEKNSPHEAVGVVCRVNGKFQVVEYSEIGDRNAEMRRPDGKLTYYAGNICNHFFTTEYLDRVCHEHNHDLPYHVAKKKIPFYCDAEKKTVTPTSNNGIKLEKFVFDVFQFSDNFVVWECKREEEFSPLKNAEGASQDTPKTAREALFALHKVCLGRSGGRFEPVQAKSGKLIQNGDGGDAKLENGRVEDLPSPKSSEPCVCEISPLLSYAGENLERFVSQGYTFKSPTLLTE